MKITKREQIMLVIIIILLLVVSVSFFGGFGNKDEEFNEDLDWLFEEDTVETDEEEVVEEVSIVIDIKGAVSSPGVYEMHSGQRVFDVIEQAGGLLTEANEAKINLAAKLQDEMVIYVPEIGEDSEQVEVVTAVAEASDEGNKVRINSATTEELERLPGVGPAKAAAILSFREENGSFTTADELLQVSGIGEKSLEQMKEQIVFN
ncbi:helix-hairpin-helix domain-containing protein [Desertibacillus haloalkaliphilus]|uniref:helix-hairpin-helix domain-containing protein n=1 Tax=Desertibacillus haloalkaliphilus TaxID=1328930 RepID=UPI0028B198A9|nr:helix-hairpin-helix domain-containing protein [Desertibacillus haloalkaliphilus]